jgi:hypothetical protein
VPYYMGDYYQGDPGIGSFLKKAVGFVGSRLPIVGGFFGKGAQKALPAAAGVATTGIVRRAGTMMGAGAASVGRIISKHPVLSAAGAAGAIGTLAGREEGMMGMQPRGQRGFHVSKKTGRVVRNRRMHVTNPKALRRAIRRAQGFAKLARRVLRFTSPRAPRGRPVFKHRKRARAA